MASNVSDIYLFFGELTTANTGGIALQSTGIAKIHVIPSRCQVKQFGVVITTKMPTTQTVDPIIKLQRQTQDGSGGWATATNLISLTIGPSNANLYFPTISTNVVAAGGPGTLYTGPALKGNRTLNTLATLVAGVVVLGKDSDLPTAMLEPGDLLQVNVTTAAVTGSEPKCVAFVRLEVAGEQAMELTRVAQDVS